MENYCIKGERSLPFVYFILNLKPSSALGRRGLYYLFKQLFLVFADGFQLGQACFQLWA